MNTSLAFIQWILKRPEYSSCLQQMSRILKRVIVFAQIKTSMPCLSAR